jgi:hypothetical protein
LAKKRRQKEVKKEDYDFKFPEFDEVKFIKKEFKKAKVAFITAGYAVLFAIVSWILISISFENWQIPVIIGFVAVFTLPLLFKKLKIDLSDYEWKSWIGAGAIYFFIWLAVFIVLCNPPFSDFAEPEIEPSCYVLDPTNGTGVWLENPAVGKEFRIPQANDTKIEVIIVDNWRLDENSPKITLIDSQGYSFSSQLIEVKESHYEIIYSGNTLAQGKYDLIIEAKDEAGHTAVYSYGLSVY